MTNLIIPSVLISNLATQFFFAVGTIPYLDFLVVLGLNLINICLYAIFKASALEMSVCVFVRVFVCSLLRYRLNVFLPPLPKVGCPIFLEIWNPWGKVVVSYLNILV